MLTTRSRTTPYWADGDSFPQWNELSQAITVDVAVVGGGVTGLTAAYLLAERGKRVIVLERGRCASADTGHTSAHLTMVTDTRLTDLVDRFGRAHAQAVWDAGLAAIAAIDDITREHHLDAGFEWVDGYLHAPLQEASRPDRLMEEARLAAAMGFDAEFLDSVPLVGRPGVRFRDQARVHPRRYLAGVARALTALGGRIHERSEVREFNRERRSLTANGHTVTFDAVVMATHNPLVGLGSVAGATLFQTKLALYTSYVVAGRVVPGRVPDALWWDTGDPYEFLRVEPHDDHDLVILGGEDHKTGQQEDPAASYRRLEDRLSALLPGIELTHRWSGQVIETPDGLPYIGETAPHQYAATGYAGNGLTFGTLAGIIIADAILARPNPWGELFDPSRKALSRGLWNYLEENADYPYYMLRDRFAGVQTRSLRAVKRGEGAIIERHGAKVAAYRDPAGAVALCSATCTHMGCTVGWNAAERTWDCPCHGSRFTPTGEVIAGPAETPLSPVE